MKTIGSQKRELLAESGMELVSENGNGALLKSKIDGNVELWMQNDDFAGYVIEIDGVGYEFIRTIS